MDLVKNINSSYFENDYRTVSLVQPLWVISFARVQYDTISYCRGGGFDWFFVVRKLTLEDSSERFTVNVVRQSASRHKFRVLIKYQTGDVVRHRRAWPVNETEKLRTNDGTKKKRRIRCFEFGYLMESIFGEFRGKRFEKETVKYCYGPGERIRTGRGRTAAP